MNPTPEQIERLPKWASTHIESLERQRRDAIATLKRLHDSDEPTGISYEENVYLDGELQFFERHLDSHRMQFVHNGASLVVTLQIGRAHV